MPVTEATKSTAERAVQGMWWQGTDTKGGNRGSRALPIPRECPWLPEQSANRAADGANWTANTAGTVGTTPMPMMILIVGFPGLARKAGFFQESRMLRGVKEAGFRIPAFVLPACDGGPGRFIELSVDLGVKSERV